MYIDIQKYGIENFSFEIIEECKKEELDKKENFYINKYDTYNNGYNLTLGKGYSTNKNLKNKNFIILENYLNNYSNIQSYRFIKVMDYEQYKKGKLTEKQYLVYSYLLSISKQNLKNEYYIFKNDILVKDVCDLIRISQPTWRKALEKLEEERYINYNKNGKYYQLYFNTDWIKLDISLIRVLIEYSQFLSEKFGGIIIILYGTIYHYWKCQKENNNECIINLTQLSKLFFADTSKVHLDGILSILQLFKNLDLMKIEEIQKNKNSTYYKIVEIKTSSSIKAYKILKEIKMKENEFIQDIIKNITSS